MPSGGQGINDKHTLVHNQYSYYNLNNGGSCPTVKQM